jgi:hypothetical protein
LICALRGYRSVRQVAKDFDLTETAVRKWVKQAGRDAGRRQNSSSYAKAWKRAGYESTRRVPTGYMGFVRTRTLTATPATVGPTPGPGQSGHATGEVILVGCVKTKAPEASSA